MHFNFYDKKVLAPAKLGSRYMDSIYGVIQSDGFRNSITLPKGSKLTSDIIPPIVKRTEHLKPFELLNLSEVQWIIIRPPMELLTTAIHTELGLNWTRNPNETDEKRIVDNLTYSDWQCAHYQWNLYKQMYFQAVSNRHIEFVELKNLSLFSDKVLNLPKEWKKSEWDFEEMQYFPTKKHTMEYLKLVYPYHYSKLMKNVLIEEMFYDIIMNSNKVLSVDVINERWGRGERIEEMSEALKVLMDYKKRIPIVDNYQKKIPKKFL